MNENLNPDTEKKSALPPIPNKEIQRLLLESSPLIHQHVAGIHLLDGSVFSGVFVKSFGYQGILTAGHCASEFLKSERIALPMTNVRHRPYFETKHLEHIPIGGDGSGIYSLEGPDLSFVIIRDESLIGMMKQNNFSFYDLDLQRPRLKEIFGGDLARFNWAVGGNPGEKVTKTKIQVDSQEDDLIHVTSALIQGNLDSYDMPNEFDYVTLYCGSDFEEFPKCYKGVSGGGIWYQRFVTTDGTTYFVDPILAGVACWQARRTTKRGYKVRAISGHAWFSIYGRVRKALHDRRVLEMDKSAET